MQTPRLSRRELLAGTSAIFCGALEAFDSRWKDTLVAFLARHRQSDGGYGWLPDDRSHVSPTFGAVGCYKLLGVPVPDAKTTADFVRNRYPVPERRRTERPLWRFDFEQVQSLLWLDEPVDSFRALAATWTAPAEFTPRYELNGNPVLQHQAMAVLVRHLVGIAPSPADQVWRDYFHQRRRANGSFHHTVAADGSGGHMTNTLWAVLALEALGEKLEIGDSLVSWIESCQLASGGFTYAPDAQIGGVDDIFYTWAALRLLDRAGRTPRRADACLRWLSSLAGSDGGYQDRPGGVPNAVATYYALDCFRLLKQEPRAASRRAAGPVLHPIPDGSRIFTMQVEAPGAGSPAEAVLMAEKLGIHIWAAKNAAPGWVAEAQRIAGIRKVPVLFAVGNEEYGTYVSVPGLGTYSHLSDLVAPASRDFGAQLPKKNFAYPWPEFRDTRIRALKNGLGRMVWQFNENEELTRALLDEAVEKRTYAAICTFHFGNENFLESQPFLMRWYGRLPMVALQDAHGGESWWWGDFLSGFRTLFIAREPTWEAWLEALDRDHVVSVRHDAITNWSTHIAGGPPHVREFIRKNSGQWVWWGEEGAPRQRPAAALTVLKPGMPFEAAVPAAGTNIRLRLWADHTGQAVPKEPRAELISLRVDDRVVKPAPVSTAHDRYWLYELQDSNARRVTAVVRVLATGKEVTLSTELS